MTVDVSNYQIKCETRLANLPADFETLLKGSRTLHAKLTRKQIRNVINPCDLRDEHKKLTGVSKAQALDACPFI